MGTTLTGTTPQDTYDSLIKVTDNGPISGTLKALSDGLGNDSTLSLSTTAASIAGTLAVTGNATFDTNTMFVDATNNRVGVGTISPTASLDTISAVSGTYSASTQQVVARIFNSPSALGSGVNSAFLSLQTTPDGSASNPVARIGVVAESYGSNDASFVVATRDGSGITERMRITAAGNVGIGTSAPASILAVSAASPTITLTATTTTATTIGNKNNRLLLLADSTTGGNGGEVVFGTGDTSTNRWAAISGNITANSGTGSAGSIIFATKAAAIDTSLTERVRILSDGGLTFNGDTAQANALDDYEEGTWTMGLSFGGGTTGIAYSSNTGTYTKIGRQVTVNGYIALSNKGSSTGTAALTGLPFTIPNSANHYSPANFWLYNVTFANQFQGYGQFGATQIFFQEITEAGVQTNLTDADFANNSEIMVSFTYFV